MFGHALQCFSVSPFSRDRNEKEVYPDELCDTDGRNLSGHMQEYQAWYKKAIC